MSTDDRTKYEALHPTNHDYAWSISGPEWRPCVICHRSEEDHQEERK